MIAAPETGAVRRFRVALARRLGLNFPDDQLPFLGDVLRRRLDHQGGAPGSYLDRLEECAGDEEWAALAELATVGETYFFRNPSHFQVLCDLLAAAREAEAPRRLRILSAGCSSGEEAYSLAMTLQERPDLLAGTEVEILAIDVNPRALARARQGLYSPWSLRETPARLKARYFRAEGRDFRLDPGICAQVGFSLRNLTVEDAGFWQLRRFEAIFCRNVLMYLLPEQARRVVARFAGSLTAGGGLFLGHAETLRGLSSAFHLCHTHGTFYHRLGEAAACRPLAADGPVAATTAPDLDAVGSQADAVPWIGAIKRSTERVAALVEVAGRDASAGGPERPSMPAASPAAMAAILESLRQERFAEAGAGLAALPSGERRHPLVALLEVVVLVHDGGIERAEAACRGLLAEGRPDARVHYLLAQCREHAGDLDGARSHYRTAAALDERFAMPHLRLALMARGRRDDEEMRVAFARTLALIEGEDELHLTLFGGGFTRQAIARLCRGFTGGGTPW